MNVRDGMSSTVESSNDGSAFTHNGMICQIEILELWIRQDPILLTAIDGDAIIEQIIDSEGITKLQKNMIEYNDKSKIVKAFQPKLKTDLLDFFKIMPKQYSIRMEPLLVTKDNRDAFLQHYRNALASAPPRSITLKGSVEIQPLPDEDKTGYGDAIEESVEYAEYYHTEEQFHNIDVLFKNIAIDPNLMPSDVHYLINERVEKRWEQLKKRRAMLSGGVDLTGGMAGLDIDLECFYEFVETQFNKVSYHRALVHQALRELERAENAVELEGNNLCCRCLIS